VREVVEVVHRVHVPGWSDESAVRPPGGGGGAGYKAERNGTSLDGLPGLPLNQPV
jgi:hypothetical protein